MLKVSSHAKNWYSYFIEKNVLQKVEPMMEVVHQALVCAVPVSIN